MTTSDSDYNRDARHARRVRSSAKVAGGDTEYDSEVDRVSAHLKLLAPVPEPRLESGRARLLREVGRLETPQVHVAWWERVVVRPAMLAAAIAVLLVMWGGTLVSHSYAAPTIIPTLTATPTQVILVPSGQVGISSISAKSDAALAPLPAPVPEPDSALIQIDKPTEMQTPRCLRL